MEIRAGTSGFSYDAWKGAFYPEGVKKDRWLAYYAERLPTVEINNTFYRMPKRAVLEKWASQVPAEFRFVLKASQRITHKARLRDVGDSVAYLFEQAEGLGERLGPVLFQLPPWLKKDVPLLAEFLATVPEGRRVAMEFRSGTWLDDDVFAVLREHGAAMCAADFDEPDKAMPTVATTSWGYLRLRASDYDDAALGGWLDRIRAQPWDEAWVFFKHEDEGVAPRLATRLLEIASGEPPMGETAGGIAPSVRKVVPETGPEAAPAGKSRARKKRRRGT